MLDYRVFVIGADGRIRQRHDLLCVDKTEAKEKAKALVDGHDVELWRRDRRIAKFPAKKRG